jgi:hypothetical protein
MNAVASRTLHVAQGLQRGSDLPLIAGSTCVIGASPALCTVVLGDKGVAPRHCALTLDARGHVTCTALDAPVRVGQRELPPGASMAMPDFLPLCCGQATLLVGPPGSDWSFSMFAAERAPGLGQRADAALQRVRTSNPAAFAALLLSSLAVAAGSVWGAVSYLAPPARMSADNLVRAQRWLQSIAPSGSELQLVADQHGERWVVSGYVLTSGQQEALAAAVGRRTDAPRAEVVSVEQMLAAVDQLARREGLACAAVYRGAGRADCGQPIADASAADRLRASSSQVAGLRELSLQVAAPKRAAVQRVAVVQRKFSVVMSKRGNWLIDATGQRYGEGDAFDGMTIRKITLDQVHFERDRGEVVLRVARAS